MDYEVRPRFIRKFILSIVISAILFGMVFVLVYNISYNKYTDIKQAQEEMKYQLLSFELEKELMKDSCQNFNPYALAEEMDNNGKIIGLLEGRLGKNNVEVLKQKTIYSLLQIRHMLYVLDYNERCNKDISIVVFFYSNQENFKEESERVGFMLDSLKNKMPELMIYSYDFDLESRVLNLIKNNYNISSPNNINIKGKTYTNTFEDYTEIENLIL